MDVKEWIDMVADEAVSEARMDPGFDVDRHVMESVDGSQWVIYRGHAVEYADEFPEVWERQLDMGADTAGEAITAAVYEDLTERLHAEVTLRLLNDG